MKSLRVTASQVALSSPPPSAPEAVAGPAQSSAGVAVAKVERRGDVSSVLGDACGVILRGVGAAGAVRGNPGMAVVKLGVCDEQAAAMSVWEGGAGKARPMSTTSSIARSAALRFLRNSRCAIVARSRLTSFIHMTSAAASPACSGESLMRAGTVSRKAATFWALMRFACTRSYGTFGMHPTKGCMVCAGRHRRGPAPMLGAASATYVGSFT